MAEYRYTDDDRRQQLRRLADALRELIPVVEGLPDYARSVPVYRQALSEAESLLDKGFSREQLSALGRSVPDLFHRFREWEPPVEKTPDGRWVEPEWYVRLEARLGPALAAARLLTELGYY